MQKTKPMQQTKRPRSRWTAYANWNHCGTHIDDHPEATIIKNCPDFDTARAAAEEHIALHNVGCAVVLNREGEAWFCVSPARKPRYA